MRISGAVAATLVLATCSAEPAAAQIVSANDASRPPGVYRYTTSDNKLVQLPAYVPVDPVTGLASSGAATGGVTRGALTDGSGVIATGGTTQQVFADSGARSYLMCQNPISATEPLFVNIGAAASTAGGSIELAPGASVSYAENFIPTGAVNVTAATTAHRFVCKAG